MKSVRWLSAGSAGSVVVGILLLLGLVSAGVTRENPIGRVAGTVTMKENGMALPEAEIVLRPIRADGIPDSRATELGLPRYRYARTEEDGSFSISNVAAGKYKLEAYGVAHFMEPLDVVVVEGRTNRFELVLEPREPYLDLYASEHVFQPSEKIAWDLHGFVKSEKVEIKVYRLRFDDVVKEGSLYSALAPLASSGVRAKDPATLGEVVLTREDEIVGRDVEGTFRLNLSVGPQDRGLYWISCKVGALTRGTYFSVSDLALVMKRAGKEFLCFSTKLDSGVPVGGAEIGYIRDGAFVRSGVSDARGLARFKLPADLPDRNTVLVARHEGSTAFVDFYMGGNGQGQSRIYIYTDRPVYRPGDEISYKGIIRKLVGTEYRVPQPGPVEIEIRDTTQNLVLKTTLQTNANGTFSGKFSTSKESEPGPCFIQASFGDAEVEEPVMVAAYRKPNYTVKVTPEKEHYIRGEKVRMTVECQYYFGGPVGGAKIEGSVQVAPRWTYYDPESDFDYSYEGYGGEWFTDVEAVTDSSGKAVITFDTRLEDETKESWNDMEFTLTASVADEAGAYFEGSGSVTVSAGEFSLVAEPSHYVVEKGQPFDVTFSAKNPVTGKSVSGEQIRVVAGYEHWDGVKSNFKPFAERSLTTGSDGKAAVVVTPEKGGNVAIRAWAEDEQGNELRSETYVWCSSRGESYDVQREEELSIRLDRKDYEQGDKAKLLIQTSNPGATALVTVEAERVYSARTVRLDSESTTLEVPVEAAYAPNVTVSVCYVKDKRFNSRNRSLVVELGKKLLQVQVASDKEVYLPGETATYSIQAKDEAGRPAPCEVSLSVVDEAIYAIRDEQTDLVNGFYPKRYNEVETQHSFTTLYLDGGDKAPANIEIRRVFKDTAYWEPAIQTDANGRARISVKLPDNLTTWRATVQAVSSKTEVGTSVSKAIARKPLMVRLQTPVYYVAGDTQRVSASVTNQTGNDADVNVELTVSGASLEPGSRQTFRVRNGETKAAEWTVAASEPGEIVYTAKAWIDERTSDGVEGKAQIVAAGRSERAFFSGDVRGSAEVKIAVSENADKTAGGISLSLSPSFAAPLFQSLDELIDFPYGCVEQTMSRFMPAAVASKVVQDLGLPKPRRAEDLPEIARESYARLERMQNYEGTWSWWEYGPGDPHMTAYVLEGIYRAKQAGFAEHGLDIGRALAWGEKELEKPLPIYEKSDEWRNRYDRDARAYLAYALALHGKREAASKALKQLDLGGMSSEGIAFVVLGKKAAGIPDENDHALGALKGRSKMSGGIVYWEEHYWGVESTARCVQALAAAEPQSSLIPMAMRYLMLNRRGYGWSSTRDTAIALLAIADYMKSTGAQIGDAAVAITVNGQPLTEVRFDAQSIAGPEQRIEIPMRLLRRGENVIGITATGAGTAYYSAELKQTVVEPDMKPFSNLEGVQIARSYHRLVQERQEDGRMRLAPLREASSRFERGEVVRCVLRITLDRPLRYFQIEDPMPSNCRIVEREDLDYGGDWTYWWQTIAIRDDRIAYFTDFAPKGTFTIEYNLRAEQPGESNCLPASAFEMYEPAKRAWTGMGVLEVTR
jgi:uncharacterized protein YfaS (alpha-2-macroglobulin family)